MRRAVTAILIGVMLITLVAQAGLAGGQAAVSAPAFPSKPIRLVVYTGPGGLLDITARKFMEIAAKYTDATFVVENKPGAGGMVGLEYVLAQEADGYTLMAVTKALIANWVSSETPIDQAELDWIAYLITDTECLITATKGKLRTAQDIFNDAKARPGQQIWVAPPGVDEVMTYKVWDRVGLAGKYVPYDAGGPAMAAVMGGAADVYVGNPADVAGKPDLQIAVVAAEQRLPQYPNVPTFKELGVKGLDNESMWRGMAVKKGTPEQAVAWYTDLCAKITADPDWRAFFEKSGMVLEHRQRDFFGKLVQQEVADFKAYLKK